jgi:hypothetical protein
LAFLAGLWHDLGKYAPDWQAFLVETGPEAPVLGEDTPESSGELHRRRRGPDHSSAGAIHALRRFGEKGETKTEQAGHRGPGVPIEPQRGSRFVHALVLPMFCNIRQSGLLVLFDNFGGVRAAGSPPCWHLTT